MFEKGLTFFENFGIKMLINTAYLFIIFQKYSKMDTVTFNTELLVFR